MPEIGAIRPTDRSKINRVTPSSLNLRLVSARAAAIRFPNSLGSTSTLRPILTALILPSLIYRRTVHGDKPMAAAASRMPIKRGCNGWPVLL